MDKRSDHLAPKKVKPKFSQLILLYILSVVILVLGTFHVLGAINEYRRQAVSQAKDVAKAGASFLSTDFITVIASDRKIINNDIKESLVRFKNNNETISSAFLYTLIDGKLTLLVDSETSGEGITPDFEMKEFQNALLGNEPITMQDDSGAYTGVLVPINDNQTGKTAAVFGINYPASAWEPKMIRKVVHAILEVIFVLVLLTAIYRLFRKNSMLASLSKRLNERETVLRSLIDHLPFGVAIGQDNKLGSTAVNKKFESILGRTPQELAELSMEELTNSKNQQIDIESFEQFKQGEMSSFTTTKKIDKPDGSSAWVNMSVVSLDKSGNDASDTSHLCIMEDVTERTFTETALRESERSKAVLLAHLPGMAYRCKNDRDWTMLFVSEGCIKLTGYEPQSLLYNNDLSYNSLITPEYQEMLWRFRRRKEKARGRLVSSAFSYYCRYQRCSPYQRCVWAHGRRPGDF